MAALFIGPRVGEFGKTWTRVIGDVLYWFELRSGPAGHRLMVMRYTIGAYDTGKVTHWLYDCDPDAYEASTRTVI